MWKRIYLYTVFVRIEILHNLLPYGTRLSPTSLGLGSQLGHSYKSVWFSSMTNLQRPSDHIGMDLSGDQSAENIGYAGGF